MKNLIEKVIQWAKDRELIKRDNSENQYLKFLEEVGETARFLLLKDATNEKLESKGLSRAKVEHEIKDGFGDIAVTIIILSAQLGIEQNCNNTEKYKLRIKSLMSIVTDTFINDDVLLVLDDVARYYGYELEECLEMAYNTISGRTGQTINGVFIKD